MTLADVGSPCTTGLEHSKKHCIDATMAESHDQVDYDPPTGLRHECGVFGCIATGEWPTQIDVPQIITLGLVALQHR
ncbi:hypothetical protein J437_LFUL017017 [Ladona fulva]|uniref:Amidophosphoribosyltransferase n=1 Tax=Ladona fulva TaxID=123851 RepID=A0A8K0KML7_LADFU|nr:hypothetical protein J437_LFUL017017 [Ladona fulva]